MLSRKNIYRVYFMFMLQKIFTNLSKKYRYFESMLDFRLPWENIWVLWTPEVPCLALLTALLGFEDSVAEDDRTLDLGSNSSLFVFVVIALEEEKSKTLILGPKAKKSYLTNVNVSTNYYANFNHTILCILYDTSVIIIIKLDGSFHKKHYAFRTGPFWLERSSTFRKSIWLWQRSSEWRCI